jgi:hypothetical protein
MLNHLAPTITQPPRLHIALQRCASVSSARACPVLRESNEALYWQLVPPVKAWVSGERCIDNDAGCVPSDEHVLPPPPAYPLLTRCFRRPCMPARRALAITPPKRAARMQGLLRKDSVCRASTSTGSLLNRMESSGVARVQIPGFVVYIGVAITFILSIILYRCGRSSSHTVTRVAGHIIQHERRAD